MNVSLRYLLLQGGPVPVAAVDGAIGTGGFFQLRKSAPTNNDVLRVKLTCQVRAVANGVVRVALALVRADGSFAILDRTLLTQPRPKYEQLENREFTTIRLRPGILGIQIIGRSTVGAGDVVGPTLVIDDGQT